MGTYIHLIGLTVASFAVLAQPAVAQEANTTLPLTYPGQVLQGDGSQTCPSEEQWGILRNEVRNDTRRLLRESVIPFLVNLPTNFSCGGSTGWRRIAYTSTCLTHPSSVPLCGRRSPPHFECVGEGLPLVLPVRVSLTPLVVNSITRCVGGSLATSLALRIPFVVLVCLSTLTMLMELAWRMAPLVNTSGPFQVVLMNRIPTLALMKDAHVSLGALMHHLFLHLWVRATSVRQA